MWLQGGLACEEFGVPFSCHQRPRISMATARVAQLAAARWPACLRPACRYKCGGCKAYVAADKSTRIEAAPHYLNICLKRFQVWLFVCACCCWAGGCGGGGW